MLAVFFSWEAQWDNLLTSPNQVDHLKSRGSTPQISVLE